VLLNAAAGKRVTGGDVWNINSGESVALEYSRYNNHGTLFWQDGPYRSSDHDPLKVGLSARKSAPTMIDILTINDFHGRIEAGSQGEAEPPFSPGPSPPRRQRTRTRSWFRPATTSGRRPSPR
jgi:5'-nucleotidase